MLWITYICECVRSIINFHSRNQDVDFEMFQEVCRSSHNAKQARPSSTSRQVTTASTNVFIYLEPVALADPVLIGTRKFRSCRSSICRITPGFDISIIITGCTIFQVDFQWCLLQSSGKHYILYVRPLFDVVSIFSVKKELLF